MSITPEREIIPKMQVEQIVKSIKRGERLDGRGLLDYRPISVILSPIRKAEGSALVKLGKTQVIVGVKLELGAPFKDRPNEGVLQVHAEFVPLASPSFEPGPPDENAIEVARIIDRSLREPRAIKLEDLVIEPGKVAWVVYNDIYLIDHDGNIVDASMLASMLALATTKMPRLVKTETGQYVVDASVRETLLPVNLLVATVTLGVIENTLFVDPSLEEELVADALIVLAVDENGRICGAQKRGEKGVPRKVLESALDIAVERGLQLIGFMKNVLNNPQNYIKPLSEI
ncbi:MAG: exosome complex protein Rrp42 [Desulfurococcaceae archaeon]|nr:exosome complex protein Rrp42 [Desulfurococcaceae archaeon]